MIGSGPDLLRLLAVPVLAWAAWSDYHTRRAHIQFWIFLIGIGSVAAIWQLAEIDSIRTVDEMNTLYRLLFIPPATAVLATVLQRMGGLGGADAKALFALGMVFPVSVTYTVPSLDQTLPLYAQPEMPLLFAIVINAILFGALYPLKMWIGNVRAGDGPRELFNTQGKRIDDLHQTPGKIKDQNSKGEAFRVDLDTLRMYLRWRGTDFEAIHEDGATLRDPRTITKTYEVGDGVIESSISPDHPLTTEHFEIPEGDGIERVPRGEDDPWAAKEFLESIDHHAYGVTPEELRDGLDVLSEKQTVRVQPAFPFLIPLFCSLVVSLTVGPLVWPM